MSDQVHKIPDENLRTEEEIKQRIAEIEKQKASLSVLDDYKLLLSLGDSVKMLRKKLESLKPPSDKTPANTESIEDRLLREAKERYEKRREDAGDNWWEMLD